MLRAGTNGEAERKLTPGRAEVDGGNSHEEPIRVLGDVVPTGFGVVERKAWSLEEVAGGTRSNNVG